MSGVYVLPSTLNTVGVLAFGATGWSGVDFGFSSSTGYTFLPQALADGIT